MLHWLALADQGLQAQECITQESPIVCLCRTGMDWLIEDPTAKDPLTQAEINYINT